MTAVRFDKRGATYGVTFHYDPELIKLLKETVPPYARSWSKPRREWIIEAVYARDFAGVLRQLGHTTIGLEGAQDDSCKGWARQLFRAVGPHRTPVVHRALTRVLHPDNADTGSNELQRQLNDARAELESQ